MYIFSLLLSSLLSAPPEPIAQMECPEFVEEVALELEPNKQYFRDTVRARVERREVSDAELFNFFKQFGENERKIKLASNELLANEIGAPIVYSMEYYQEKYFGLENHLTIHHVPAAVTYQTPFGHLAGDSQGEFGGELVFVNNSGVVELIQDMNVEDIYKFDFGYVVTAGLRHMGSDRGTLYLVTFLDGEPQITTLFGLIGAPETSLKLSNGDLLINSRDGSQVLRTDGSLERVSCVSNANRRILDNI
ncbi:hypothetical protein [Aliidiomarina sp. B3213]|nr:hypothetical protein [Aliidiomarina sp. B3213]RTE86960.1 hypothetical protein DQX04_00795 [Aliidiomarina sp. B3213]TCZ93250.1 hypothetical protein EYQ95_04505 [Lysobacter sp. N42]